MNKLHQNIKDTNINLTNVNFDGKYWCFMESQLKYSNSKYYIKVSSFVIIYKTNRVQLKSTKASPYRDMRDYILLYDTLWLK